LLKRKGQENAKFINFEGTKTKQVLLKMRGKKHQQVLTIRGNLNALFLALADISIGVLFKSNQPRAAKQMRLLR
jgi:hypothetical protein